MPTTRVSLSGTSRCPKLAALLWKEAEDDKNQEPAYDKHAAAIKSISAAKSALYTYSGVEVLLMTRHFDLNLSK